MTNERKEVEGQINTIDHERRFFTLEDRAGIIFVKIFWDSTPYFDARMKRQKPGFYEKIPVAMTGEDTAHLIDIQYSARPEDWPKRRITQKFLPGGQKRFQPRNERLIVAQCLVKAYTDLWIATETMNSGTHPKTFEEAREEILKAVEQDTEKVMAVGTVEELRGGFS